ARALALDVCRHRQTALAGSPRADRRPAPREPTAEGRPRADQRPAAMTRSALIGRTLSRTIRAVRAMDHGVGRLLGRRRVLVDARSPLSFAVMAPVVDALRRDARIDVDVTSEGRHDIRRVFEQAGLGDRIVDRQRVKWTRYDLYLNADPWNPPALARTARRISFFHGVAGKYDLDQPKNEARPFDGYDRVAFINTDRM